MSPVPFGRRDRLISEVGPDASGSYPGFAWTHSPEKSGTDAALASPLAASPAVGTTACPKAGVAATAASVTTRRKFRDCKSIALLLFQRSDHSPLMSASFTTFCHIVISRKRNSPNCSGVPPRVTIPCQLNDVSFADDLVDRDVVKPDGFVWRSG